METQLQYGGAQAYVMAQNIFNFPEDYKDDKYPILGIIFMLDRSLFKPSREIVINRAREIARRTRDIDVYDALFRVGGITIEEIKENEAQLEAQILQRAENRAEMKEAQIQNGKQSAPSVYGDSQNVHSTKINQCVNIAASKLFKLYKHMFTLTLKTPENVSLLLLENINNGEPIEDYKTTDRYKQVENKYKNELCNVIKDEKVRNTILKNQGIFGVPPEAGLKDIFLCVWFFIQEHRDRVELSKRMEEEMLAMRNKCTSGYASRLINIIQGYTEDDDLIIKISDEDQAKAVVSHYLTKVISGCKNEKILEGLTEPNEEFQKFVRIMVSQKLLEWKNVYKYDLTNIAKIVNNYCGQIIFKV